jgi:hypothetical protein
MRRLLIGFTKVGGMEGGKATILVGNYLKALIFVYV